MKIFLGVIIGVVLLIGVTGLGPILWRNTFGVANENSKTNVIHQTNQYANTQISDIRNKIDVYNDPNSTTEQKAAALSAIWAAADSISKDRLDDYIRTFLTTHPRS